MFIVGISRIKGDGIMQTVFLFMPAVWATQAHIGPYIGKGSHAALLSKGHVTGSENTLCRKEIIVHP